MMNDSNLYDKLDELFNAVIDKTKNEDIVNDILYIKSYILNDYIKELNKQNNTNTTDIVNKLKIKNFQIKEDGTIHSL